MSALYNLFRFGEFSKTPANQAQGQLGERPVAIVSPDINPKIVNLAIHWLRTQSPDLNEEGVFRIPGDLQKVNELSEKLSQMKPEDKMPDLSAYPVHAVIGCIKKQFMDKLPVLPEDYDFEALTERIKQCSTDEKVKAVIDEVKNLLRNNPCAKSYLLLLKMVSTLSDENKMTVINLAIILNPAINPLIKDPLKMMQNPQKASDLTVAKFLIENADVLCDFSEKEEYVQDSERSSLSSSSPAHSDEDRSDSLSVKTEDPFAWTKNLQMPTNKRLYLLRKQIQNPNPPLTTEEKEKGQELFNQLILGAGEEFFHMYRGIKLGLQTQNQNIPNQNRDYVLEALEKLVQLDTWSYAKSQTEAQIIDDYGFELNSLFNNSAENVQNVPREVRTNLLWLIQNIDVVGWQNMLRRKEDKNLPYIQHLENNFDLNLIIKYILPFIVDPKIVIPLGNKGSDVQAIALLFLKLAKDKFIEHAPDDKKEQIKGAWAQFYNELKDQAI